MSIVMMPRFAVEPELLWNSTSVFADDNAWQEEFAACAEELPRLAKAQGTLGPDAGGTATRLLNFLNRRQAVGDRISRLHVYAGMSQAVDSNDVTAQGMVGQVMSLFGRFANAVAFVEPELLAMGEAVLSGWIASKPALGQYRHYFDDLFRQAKHVRSAEVEAVLGDLGEVFASVETVHDMLVNADFRFPAVRGKALCQSTVEALLKSGDRRVRKAAWKQYCDRHLEFRNTLAANYLTSVRRNVFLARSRHHASALDAALSGDNLPRAVYETTLDTFQRKLPIWHRYWSVKRRALGVSKLRHWDIWAPAGKPIEPIAYQRAVDLIADAMAPLGKSYVTTLRQGCLQDGWVDVMPTIGKSAGAFSSGCQGTHPFIMMSWTDDLSSLSTLAHELGHSMHSYNSWKKQPSIYAEYSIFAAEVASNFNQAMVRAHLFAVEKDPDFQIGLIEEAIENLHRYLFIMPTLARFELEVHRRVEAAEAINAEDLNALMASLFAEGYGDAMALDLEREGSTWAQFMHLYMPFYVFQYTTGIGAAHALAGPILDGDKDARDRYLEFLSAGGSLYPVEALRRAGVDMESPAPVEAAFAVLEKLVDRLEALVDAGHTRASPSARKGHRK